MADKKIRIRKKGTTQPALVISKLPKGAMLISEGRAMEAQSPNISRRLADMTTVNGGKASDERSIWDQVRAGSRERATLTQLGEKPAYVLYKALEDNQKISFKCHYPGDILELDLLKTGPIIAVRSAFMVAFYGVHMGIHTITDFKLIQMSDIGQFMQRLAPGKAQIVNGIKMPQKVFLEVHGDVMKVDLYSSMKNGRKDLTEESPPESIMIVPNTLLAFSEGVEMELVNVSDLELRQFEGINFLIKLTCSKEKDCKVWLKTMSLSDFETKG